MSWFAVMTLAPANHGTVSLERERESGPEREGEPVPDHARGRARPMTMTVAGGSAARPCDEERRQELRGLRPAG